MINKPLAQTDKLFIERTPYPRNFQLIAFEYIASLCVKFCWKYKIQSNCIEL